MKHHVLTRAGCMLSAMEDGEGHPLLFYHGGLTDHDAARMHIAQLSDANRVITPDLRGCGRSKFHGQTSWDLLVGDAVALLDQLEIPCAVVGGVSLGAAVALRLTLAHPERVAGLALIHPSLRAADQPVFDGPTAALAGC